jgi:hypothetical protein
MAAPRPGNYLSKLAASGLDVANVTATSTGGSEATLSQVERVARGHLGVVRGPPETLAETLSAPKTTSAVPDLTRFMAAEFRDELRFFAATCYFKQQSREMNSTLVCDWGSAYDPP